MPMRRNRFPARGRKCLLVAGLAAIIAAGGTTYAAADPLTRFLDGLFKQEQPQAQPQAKPRAAPQKPRPATRQVPRKPQPATVIVRDAQQKREANAFIAVIGDSLAESLVGGLRDAFAATNEIAVVNRASNRNALGRTQDEDWKFLTRDYMRDSNAATQPITLGVVLFGADDKQSILDGTGKPVPFGTPEWQAAMSAHIDTAIRAFADRGVPLVWVGPPPMKAEAHNTMSAALNALYREEVLKAGGVFVDIWSAFSSEDKGFIANGPDVRGQDARLRTADGIGLTASGARKVAHFTEIEIRRLLQARGIATVIASPTGATDNQSTGGPSDALLSLPDMPVPVVIPVKPVAGPILPLLALQPTPDGTLLHNRPAAKGDAAALIHRVYGEGRAPEPVTGRADDFSWQNNAIAGDSIPASVPDHAALPSTDDGGNDPVAVAARSAP